MKIYNDLDNNSLCILDENDIEELVSLQGNYKKFDLILIPKEYKYHILEDVVKILLNNNGKILYYIN